MGVTDHSQLILNHVLAMQRRHDARLAGVERRIDRLVILLSTQPARRSWSGILTAFFNLAANPPLKLFAGGLVLVYLFRGGDAGSAIGFLLKLIAL